MTNKKHLWLLNSDWCPLGIFEVLHFLQKQEVDVGVAQLVPATADFVCHCFVVGGLESVEVTPGYDESIKESLCEHI